MGVGGLGERDFKLYFTIYLLSHSFLNQPQWPLSLLASITAGHQIGMK